MISRKEQPAPILQLEEWFTPCLSSHPCTPQGEEYLQDRPSGRGTLERVTSERLSPPADSISRCWSTSTSEVFQATSACCKFGTVMGGCSCVTSPKCSSKLWGSVSKVHGRGGGFIVCGCGARGVDCGRVVCSPICWPCSGGTIG